MVIVGGAGYLVHLLMTALVDDVVVHPGLIHMKHVIKCGNQQVASVRLL
jgi:hypothetical protein